MPKSPDAVSHAIQKLLSDRQQHLDAVATIDATLQGVNAALKGNGSPAGAPAGKKRRRRRQRFEVSGDESVLAFIRQKKTPTSQEIEQRWKSEGRGGTAANVLSKLYKDKKVTRVPLKTGRGSRYSVA